jgi:hypothetical protein
MAKKPKTEHPVTDLIGDQPKSRGDLATFIGYYGMASYKGETTHEIYGPFSNPDAPVASADASGDSETYIVVRGRFIIDEIINVYKDEVPGGNGK